MSPRLSAPFVTAGGPQTVWGWVAEQIAGWLNRQFPEDTHPQISHETIYRRLFIQTRRVLKNELTRHLRSRRRMRPAKRASTKEQPRGRIFDGISIRERPAAIHDRAIPGHGEGDLLLGSNNTHMATLVERLPGTLRRSLAWD